MTIFNFLCQKKVICSFSRLDGWRTIDTNIVGPALFRTTFTIEDSSADTFIDMSKWGKGIVFINGFNLGRYFNLGPPKTLYVPAPLLRQGENEVNIYIT